MKGLPLTVQTHALRVLPSQRTQLKVFATSRETSASLLRYNEGDLCAVSQEYDLSVSLSLFAFLVLPLSVPLNGGSDQ